MAGELQLSGDAEVIEAYGRQHPDEYAGVWLADGPSPRLVAAFTGELVRHCVALRERVAHPDRLQIVRREHSIGERTRIRAEIERHMVPDGPVIAVGDGGDHVSVSLRADGEDLAAQLVERYGDAVRVEIAGAPYPPSEAPDPTTRCPAPGGDPWPSGVSARLELADDTVVAGGDVRGTVTITNSSDRPFRIDDGGPKTAMVFPPGDTTPVGTFTGALTGEAIVVDVPPGGRQTFDVVVGTAACDLRDGYALAPGQYEARAVIGGSDGPSLLSGPAPLRVVEG